jgi:hypothetical protein
MQHKASNLVAITGLVPVIHALFDLGRSTWMAEQDRP